MHSSNCLPTVVYYEVQGFQPASLRVLAQDFEVHTCPEPGQERPESLERAKAIFAPMGYRYDREFLARFPNLETIGTPTTGTMHIEDAATAERGIVVCSLKSETELLASISATAELAFGLVLCLTRHIPEAFESVKNGQWIGRSFGERTPGMLSRMRLGVIGLGRLGGMMARYGRAFGMQVGYYDPHVEDRDSIRFADPLELAANSDVVSLHVHSTPATRNLVDERFLRAMPRGAYLVNTARGDIVDEAALLHALESGHLGGAGLDMITGDHDPGFAQRIPGHPLFEYARQNANLIITPHYGGATRDAWEVTEQRIITRMREALEARSTSCI
jgi:D-3-phosphoglycerate dehydrogenase